MGKTSLRHIQGLGTDIIEIERIRQALARHGDRFLNYILSPNEVAYCKRFKDPSERVAGRFAAKEAFFKATGIGRWHDVEILTSESGKPELLISPRLKKQLPKASFFVSISHAKEYAVATVVYLEEHP